MKITINQNPAIKEPEVIINCREMNARIRNLADSIRQYSMTLPGEIEGIAYYVPLETVVYIESANKQTFFYDCSRVFRSRNTLSELEGRLGNVHFVRISKYCIVNLAKIQGIRSCGNHRLELTLANGERLLTGRVYQKKFLQRLDCFHAEQIPSPYIKAEADEAEPLYAAQRCVYNEGSILSFPEAPHRTAALSYGAAELLCALGLGDRLAAVAPAEDILEHTLPAYREVISKIPLLKNKGDGIPAMPDLEALGIDLVVCSWYYPQLMKQEIRTSFRLPVYITESTVPEKAGMEQLYRDILNLGRIFRVEDRAICLVAQSRLKIAALNRRVSRRKPVRVFVYDGGEAEPLTAFRGTLEHDLIALAGGTNVFGNQDGSYHAVTWRQVGETKPEVILFHDYPDSMSIEEKMAYLKSRPELQDSPAIEHQRFITLTLAEVFPGIQSADAIRQMIRVFHPEAL